MELQCPGSNERKGFDANVDEMRDAAIQESKRNRQASITTPQEAAAHVVEAVMQHPLNREPMLEILHFCSVEHTMSDIDEHAAGNPLFRQATQNPARLTAFLVDADGVVRIERDANGREVLPTDKEGLDEDAVDDLVRSIGFLTTEAGALAAESLSPANRFQRLIEERPERSNTYGKVLEFIDEQPRTYGQIKTFLEEAPILNEYIEGRWQELQPSVFVDKLEAAGLLLWNKGWCLTDAGRSVLASLNPVSCRTNRKG